MGHSEALQLHFAYVSTLLHRDRARASGLPTAEMPASPSLVGFSSSPTETTWSCWPCLEGGVPVAYEIATALGAPMDVFVVRKLGLPTIPSWPWAQSPAAACAS